MYIPLIQQVYFVNHSHCYKAIELEKKYYYLLLDIHFRIRRTTQGFVCSSRKCLFTKTFSYFGIVSKNTPLQETSCLTTISFGWVLLNGSGQLGYKYAILQDNILELFLGCDRQMIRVITERTNDKHELDVTMITCSFPWQTDRLLFAIKTTDVRYLSAVLIGHSIFN